MFKSLHMKLMLIMLLLITSLMAVVGAFLTTSVTSFYIDTFYQQMSSAFGADRREFVSDLRSAAAQPEEISQPAGKAPEEAGDVPRRESVFGWLKSRLTRTHIMRSLDMAKAPDATKRIRLLYSPSSAASSRAASCSARISSSVFSGSAPEPSSGS